jgi:hypothetical protein
VEASSKNHTVCGLASSSRRRGIAGVLLVLCAGTATAGAAEPQAHADPANLNLARAEAKLKCARELLELYAELAKQVESLTAVGHAQPFERERTLIEFSRAQDEASARALDVEEIRISGLEPNNALSAPLVGGRDFVSERLKQRRTMIAEQMKLGKQVTELEKALINVGWGDGVPSELAGVFETANAISSSLEAQVELRQGFLSGKLSADRADWEQQRLELEARRSAAVPRLERAEKALKIARLLHDSGRSGRSDVPRCDIERHEAALELELIQLDLQIVENKLATLRAEPRPTGH